MCDRDAMCLILRFNQEHVYTELLTTSFVPHFYIEKLMHKFCDSADYLLTEFLFCTRSTTADKIGWVSPASVSRGDANPTQD